MLVPFPDRDRLASWSPPSSARSTPRSTWITARRRRSAPAWRSSVARCRGGKPLDQSAARVPLRDDLVRCTKMEDMTAADMDGHEGFGDPDAPHSTTGREKGRQQEAERLLDAVRHQLHPFALGAAAGSYSSHTHDGRESPITSILAGKRFQLRSGRVDLATVRLRRIRVRPGCAAPRDIEWPRCTDSATASSRESARSDTSCWASAR